MKCWCAMSKDDVRYFINWSKINGKSNKIDYVVLTANLKLFGIFGEMILWPQEHDEYFRICHDTVKAIFVNGMKEYSLYWYIGVPLNTDQPKISQYKKVWKSVERDVNLEGLTLGPEIEASINHNKHFISIAKLNSVPFSEQFKSILCRGLLIASKSPNLLSEEFLKSFSGYAHFDYAYQFDFVSIMQNRCSLGDIVFLYENDCEKQTVCLAFNEEKSEVFRKYVTKYFS